MNTRQILYDLYNNEDDRISFEKHLESIYNLQNWEFWKSVTELIDEKPIDEKNYISKNIDLISNFLIKDSYNEVLIFQDSLFQNLK